MDEVFTTNLYGKKKGVEDRTVSDTCTLTHSLLTSIICIFLHILIGANSHLGPYSVRGDTKYGIDGGKGLL